MGQTEKQRDALRKQCFDLCVACRHGHPYDEATGVHTKKMSGDDHAKIKPHFPWSVPIDANGNLVTPCAAKAIRDQLKALGGHSITEIA